MDLGPCVACRWFDTNYARAGLGRGMFSPISRNCPMGLTQGTQEGYKKQLFVGWGKVGFPAFIGFRGRGIG